MNKKILCVALAAMLFALDASVEAQQKPARIGFLGGLGSPRVEVFRDSLRDLGYVEGKNITIEYRNTSGRTDDLPALAAELVRLKVNVIVTLGTTPTLAAMTVTRSIPIVMTNVSDPVGYGFVDSLARPGGNVTGLTNFGPELSGKRLELLKEVLPKTSRVAIFSNPAAPVQSFLVREMQAPAEALSMKLIPLEFRDLSANQVEGALKKKGHFDAIMVLLAFSKPVFAKRIVELAASYRLPATYHWQEYVEAGGLMYYGSYLPEIYRRAAVYVDKILKGTKPADLPVEQPTKFEFIINLKAAKQIGLNIPPNVLARADRVIR